MLGVGLRPDAPLTVAGASLIIGGLAGFAQADWHAITLDAFRAAVRLLERDRRPHNADDDSTGDASG